MFNNMIIYWKCQNRNYFWHNSLLIYLNYLYKKITSFSVTGVMMNRSFLTIAALAFIPTTAMGGTIHMVETPASHLYVSSVLQTYSSWNRPEVESVNPGSEFTKFCSGTVDIVGSFRLMSDDEKQTCSKIHITQYIIGYEIVSFVMTYRNMPAAPFIFTEKQVREALSKPHVMWSDIDKNLPHTMIEVYGLNSQVKATVEGILSESITTDSWIDAGNDSDWIISKISTSPDAVGVFTYSFAMNNLDKLRPLVLGTAPSSANISSKVYPFQRPLVLYINNDLRNGADGIANEFIKGATMPDGYLLKFGLTPSK